MTVANFNCSLSNLADTTRLGWFEYEQYQNRFAAHKPSKYTATYGADSLALLNDFVAMADYQSHAKNIQNARDLFTNEVKTVSVLFKTLKNYINELTPDKTMRTNYHKDAGQQLFDELGAYSADGNDKLLGAMIRFVESHQVELTAKDLPANFVQQLKDKQTSLSNAHKAWLAAKDTATAASDAKITAGNELKNRLSAMFLDAQIIFLEEKDTAKKFVWDMLLTKVRGVKDTGLGGKTINGATEKAASGIIVAIPLLNLSVVSDANGRYEFPVLPEGTYDIEAKGDGFKTLVVEKRVVKAGVIGRLNLVLEAA
ncbi:MAG: carboxypeptidase regulatory-like domain-containing protein [Saprospiraceae bacterium]|nr:carboxypeptidase regulatory-like domain-containing protein [Saprospiraceae bacterium]